MNCKSFIDTSILVNSCDKNEYMWMPFFTLFFKFTKGLFSNVYLNTEIKEFHFNDVKTINHIYEKSFSTRLIDSLKTIKTKYVIIFLDDYFLQDFINEDLISKAKKILDNNCNIIGIYFKKINGSHRSYDPIFNYVERKQYLINFQVGIWKTKDLINVLYRNLSAWDIENLTELPNGYRTNELLCVNVGNNLQIIKGEPFPYLWSLQSGYGVCKGVFLWNNKKLFKKENINFSYRGIKKISYISYLIKSKIGIKINK